jgi:hypothetical protein
MLATLVSDTWLTDPAAPIFIDRDGERFKYVLDYFRYGKMPLPLSVPREMLLLDMEYYGFAHKNHNEIACSTLAPSQIDEMDVKNSILKGLKESIETVYLELT